MIMAFPMSYEKMLQNPEFCAILEELVDFGICEI